MDDGSAVIGEAELELGRFRTRALTVDGDGPPMLLLHGFTDSADTWRRVLRRLAEQGQRAVAVDLPSHGQASSIDRGEDGLDALVEFAAAAASHVGDGKPVVVAGNSLGGLVTLTLASCHPDLVAAIVPVGPAGVRHPSWFTGMRRFAPPPRDPNAPATQRRRRGVRVRLPRVLAGPTLEAGVRYLGFARPRSVPRGYLASYRRNFSSIESRKAIGRLAFGIGERALSRPYADAPITCPAVIVWGDRDRLCSPSGAAELAAELQGETRVVMLERVGHIAQMEAPGRVTAALLEAAAMATG